MANINNNNGGNMPLEVHYKNDISWDAKTSKYVKPEYKAEADHLGHMLMIIGVPEISPKTIKEVITRQMILDRLYPSISKHTLEEYTEIFSRHLGLEIQGRWAGTETRLKFATRHLKSVMRDIDSEVSS